MAKTADGEKKKRKKGKSASKGSKKKLILFGALGVLVLCLIGGGVAFSVATASNSGEEAADPLSPSVYHEMPQFVVGIPSEEQGMITRSTYIRLTVMAELGSPEDALKLRGIEEEVLDGFQDHVKRMKREQLSGREGTERLRMAFVDILNKKIRPAKARNVLFREIVLQ